MPRGELWAPQYAQGCPRRGRSWARRALTLNTLTLRECGPASRGHVALHGGRSDCRTEACNRFGLVVERLEDRRKLRNDEKIRQALRSVQQFQHAALTLGCGV